MVGFEVDSFTMSLVRRRVLALTTVLLVTLGTTVLPAVAAPADESEFVALINQSRAGAGLAPLSNYSDLVDDARRHTADMIAQGKIFHSSSAELSAATTGWSQLGENVGMGPNPSVLHQAFMASSGHRANILGDYDRVGVGADRAADGTMFVTVIFMKTAGSSTTTTTAPPTTTTTAPPATTTTAAPAAPTPTTTAPPPATTTTTAPPAPAPRSSASPTPGTGTEQPQEIPTVAQVTAITTAWLELEAMAGAYCVTVRIDGAICVE